MTDLTNVRNMHIANFFNVFEPWATTEDFTVVQKCCVNPINLSIA
jgi:hypothetical protein